MSDFPGGICWICRIQWSKQVWKVYLCTAVILMWMYGPALKLRLFNSSIVFSLSF